MPSSTTARNSPLVTIYLRRRYSELTFNGAIPQENGIFLISARGSTLL